MIIRGVEQVRAFVDMYMSERGFSAAELARTAEVCTTTVSRLISEEPGRQTKSPHFLTVLKIVRALGFRVSFVE